MFSNPFDRDVVEDFDLGAATRREGVAFHAAAYERLVEYVRDAIPGTQHGLEIGDAAPRHGGAVLLTSRRAGYGKTHLLARLKAGLPGDEALVVPLGFRPEQLLDWHEQLAALIDFADAAPANHGLSPLEEATRRVFGLSVADLIETGEVPCAKPEEALRSLRENWHEVFDREGGDQAVVAWFEEVFPALADRLSQRLSDGTALSPAQARFWIAQLFEYHGALREGKDARSACLERMIDAPLKDPSEEAPEMSARAKFHGLAQVLRGDRALVYVVDHLDSFFHDAEGVFEVVSRLLDLPAPDRPCVVIVSLNEDLWASSFEGCLPSAFEDRLTGRVLDLDGIDGDSVRALVDERLARAGIPDDVKAEFGNLLDLERFVTAEGAGTVTPRRVLRYARECWDHFAGMGYRVSSAGGGAGAGAGVASAATEFVDLGKPTPAESKQVDPLELPAVDFLQVESPGEAPGAVADADAGDKEVPFTHAVIEEGLAGIDSAGLVARPHERESEAQVETGTGARERHRGFQQLVDRIRGRIGSGAMIRAREDSTFEEDLIRARFSQLRRREMASGVNGGIDLGAMRTVLETVGQGLPMLMQEWISLPGTDRRALGWVFDGDVVLFGFQSPTNYPFWQALIDHAMRCRRAVDEDGGIPEVKLVVFSRENEALDLASWTALHEVLREGARLIDCVELNRNTVASFGAGGRLIEEARGGQVTYTEEDSFRLLARELDFLWSRLTRPIEAGA